jgi:phospholipid/cholesterol/gamma-HCH transport system ATP-binding protein
MASGSRADYKEQPIVQVRHLKKSFGPRQVLRDISFDVWPGETLGIIGPSGCGKSTILKLLCGLIPKDGGEIITRTEDIGLVFQAAALLNSLTVRQNLALALRARQIPKDEEDKRIKETLGLVGLLKYMDAYPAQLSGGMQKRVSFARAVVYQPQIILYDEPTTGLDPVMSTTIEDYMIELEDKLSAASIVVTHQYSTWKRTATRIILLDAGLVVWEGKPDEAESSDNKYIQQFVHATREGPMTVI